MAPWLAVLTLAKEYEQALQFDQLRQVMASGEAFSGFNEAPIDFPPTFKYDVLRTIKRSRHKSFKRAPPTPTLVALNHEKMLSEVTERTEREPPSIAVDDQQDHQSEPNGNDEPEPDGASVMSSTWMSVRSRRTIDPSADDDEDEQEPISPKSFGQSPPASASAANLAHKVLSATAAHKAKEKWMSIFHVNGGSPKSPPHRSSPSKRSKWRQSWSSHKVSTPLRRASQPEVDDPLSHTQVDPADPRQPQAKRRKELQDALLDAVHSRSHQHLALSENNVDLEEEDKGVYDSSHKQRVPSW